MLNKKIKCQTCLLLASCPVYFIPSANPAPQTGFSTNLSQAGPKWAQHHHSKK